jgi:hypothetical protein
MYTRVQFEALGQIDEDDEEEGAGTAQGARRIRMRHPSRTHTHTVTAKSASSMTSMRQEAGFDGRKGAAERGDQHHPPGQRRDHDSSGDGQEQDSLNEDPVRAQP